MDNENLEVLHALDDWLGSGACAWLCTIVATFGSSPRPVGSLLAINDRGQAAGSLSGGCVEDDLLDALRSRSVAADGPERLAYGVSQAETARLGLPCGGRLEVIAEPLIPSDRIRNEFTEILALLSARRRCVREVDLETGATRVAPDTSMRPTALEGARLCQRFGPRQRLVLVGAGQIARYLSEIALALDFEVVVTDPRPELLEAWAVTNTHACSGMPDDVVREWAGDANSAVITLTHDPRIDDMALMEALRGDNFYVGALGSRRTSDKRRQRLSALDLRPDQIDRLDAPVGLDIGSKTPPEIAVAIAASLIELRNRPHARPEQAPPE
ncbi:MAG: XdhC family protein [Pseudomonadota bacterium]|nr:XdhC family protein [Pseudomonadota bacterium]